jgi:hypothetical protein
MGRSRLGMCGQPACARGACTVLCAMPILWPDVLRGQGKDLGVSRAHQHRGDGGMIREGWALAEPTGETGLTRNDGGRKVVGASEGHAPLIAKAPKMRPHAVLCKALKDLKQHRLEVAGCDRIEPRSALMVTGNLSHAPQGVGVMVACGALRTRLQGEWRSMASFSVEPGEIGLTALEEAGDGIDQGAKGRLAQLAAGLTQR